LEVLVLAEVEALAFATAVPPSLVEAVAVAVELDRPEETALAVALPPFPAVPEVLLPPEPPLAVAFDET
jgi:hypothetical protein